MAAPETVWSLVDGGFRVAAFTRKGRTSALRHSHHVTFHEITSPESDLVTALSDLRSLLASLGKGVNGTPSILFPLDDKAVWLSSQLALPSSWWLAGPQGSTAELALNKCVQVRLAEQAGFRVPQTAVARNAADVFACSGKAAFPLILKPAECVPVVDGHWVNCKKWVCADQGELQRAVDQWGEQVPLLVQPFIAGTGEGLFGLAAPEGVRAWSGHRRLRMMNPQGSGSSACISQAVPEDLKATAQAFVSQAQWRGMFMIELLRDRQGKLWFVELNGRPWGSMALSRAQGLEYPAWHIQLALDPESQVGLDGSSEPGLVCRNAGREFMHLLFVLEGPKSKALRGWPSFWRTLADVARVHDGDTFYNWRREDANVFFADFCYTVRDNVFKSRN